MWPFRAVMLVGQVKLQELARTCPRLSDRGAGLTMFVHGGVVEALVDLPSAPIEAEADVRRTLAEEDE